MNYKKGLSRIFVIGLIITPIVGFFSASEDADILRRDFSNRSYDIQAEIKHVLCEHFVKENPKKFPELKSHKACYWTFVYWDSIKKWQDENGKAGQVIDQVSVSQAMSAFEREAIKEVRLTQTWYYVVGYIFLWLASFVIFFISRWVIRGFKSK